MEVNKVTNAIWRRSFQQESFIHFDHSFVVIIAQLQGSADGLIQEDTCYQYNFLPVSRMVNLALYNNNNLLGKMNKGPIIMVKRQPVIRK